MHKFVQRNHVRIVRNECNRSTPLDPKLMFWGVSNCLLLHELQCKTGWTGAINAQVRITKSRRNFSQQTHPINPIGPQTHVLWHFWPFRYCTKVGAKKVERVQWMHLFIQRRRVGIFYNECTRSTPLDPKLKFWSVSDRFVAARTLVQNGSNCCI
jgi:hypothetical protein